MAIFVVTLIVQLQLKDWVYKVGLTILVSMVGVKNVGLMDWSLNIGSKCLSYNIKLNYWTYKDPIELYSDPSGVAQNKYYNNKEYINYKVDFVVNFVLFNSKIYPLFINLPGLCGVAQNKGYNKNGNIFYVLFFVCNLYFV